MRANPQGFVHLEQVGHFQTHSLYLSISLEIKSSRTYRQEFLKGIEYYQMLITSPTKGLLIYDGDLEFDHDHAAVRNFRQMVSTLETLSSL